MHPMPQPELLPDLSEVHVVRFCLRVLLAVGIAVEPVRVISTSRPWTVSMRGSERRSISFPVIGLWIMDFIVSMFSVKDRTLCSRWLPRERAQRQPGAGRALQPRAARRPTKEGPRSAVDAGPDKSGYSGSRDPACI